MSEQGSIQPDEGGGAGGRSVMDVVAQIGRFSGPPERFLEHLLRLQCEAAPAEAAAALRSAPEGVQVVAVHPPAQGGAPPPWLAACIRVAPEVVRSGKSRVVPLHEPDQLYGQPAKRRVVIIPLGTQDVAGAAGFAIASRDDAGFAVKRERLELTRTFLSLYEMRLASEQRGADMARMRAAMETLAALGEHERFKGVAMTLCNEVAARWQCDRVALGFLKGRYVQLKALSHTEKISRKMKLIQDIEAAMEECLDQDVEVMHPAPADASYFSRAARDLSVRHGPTTVAGLPIRRKGDPIAVLTVERPVDQPLQLGEIESLRLTCDLCTARVVNLHEHDRWFGARAAGAARKGLAALVGPRHTWAKLAAVAVFAAAVFLIFAKGDYRAQAPFVLETTEKQVIPAPFGGYLKSVKVEPPDGVEANDVLAKLDTAELRLELASSRAELAGYLKQAAAAMRDGKTVEAQIAQAQADKVRAEIRLLRYRISQADIVSPLGGVVLRGELKRQIGAPVKTGDVLFEVAPTGSLRAVLSVPEDLIADVAEADRRSRAEGRQLEGELAAAARPDVMVRYVVERINPVAEVVNQRNVFKVRARLLDAEAHDWMQPSMEGVAKTHVGRRRYVWIWTRRLVNWLRLKLWM